MAIRRFSTASISTGNSKSTKLWDQETFQSGMFALATVSLTSTASTVTFSGIPSNYTHLQVRAILRSTRTENSDGPLFRVGNGSVDTSNYSWHFLKGDGSATAANGFANQSSLGLGDFPAANRTSGVFGAFVVDVFDYANTNKYKTTRALNGYDSNSGADLRFVSGSWRSTSAIDIITFFPEVGSFAANSHFALYGIKAA
jgi:hypothetical protein